jgi:spore coat protein U-like protein
MYLNMDFYRNSVGPARNEELSRSNSSREVGVNRKFDLYRGDLIMKAIRSLLVSFFVLSIAFTGNSMGATASGSIYVQTEAAVVCVTQNVALDLGTYTGDVIAQTSSFDVQCSDTTPYTISYDEGSNFLNGTRRLSDGISNYLTYYLICEAISGSGVGPECGNGTTIGFESSGTGTGLAQPFAIEAGLYAGQYVPAGTYWDDVFITVTY